MFHAQRLFLAAGLLMISAGAAAAQTEPARDRTADLNALPPMQRPVEAPAPAPVEPARPPVQAVQPPAPPQPRPAPAPVPTPPAAVAAPPRPVPAPVQSAPAPVPTAPAPVRAASPAPSPAAAASPAPPPVVAPAEPRALGRAELEALPFTLSLAAPYTVTAGRPGPDFQVWTVRKDGIAQLMIYAGPAAQFPIHDGQLVEAGGRTTVVVMEEGRRRALEHLFRQAGPPRQIHVWVASLDGEDRDRAEAMAHTVSPR